LPHDFGRASPPLITDLEMVRKKMDLLDTLCDIEIAAALINEAKEVNLWVLCIHL
jgi:poly [ADP-ribose] polymerase